MKSNSESVPAFHAGICMAGAISAGAYTAGVVDYLLEALENWQRAKELQEAGKLKGVPKHNFIIEVLGGASAGGMTAAITAAGLQEYFKPVTQADENNTAITNKNPFYNAWVNLKENEGSHRDMMDHLLSTDDIENDIEFNASKEVRAGFNSAFIKDIAQATLQKRIDNLYKRSYLAPDADVFTTVTNLRGFSYKVTFDTSTGIREHRMKMHRDYAFFKLSEEKATDPQQVVKEMKTETGGSTYNLPHDGRIPINFKTGYNIDVLKDAAMSTGAFPVGLESRELKRKKIYIEQNKYLNLILSGENDENVKYDFLPEGEHYHSLNVDGGVINNEPYEITQQLLDDRRKNQLSKEESEKYIPKLSAAEFENVVLMIDPFPNDDTPEPAVFTPKKAWKNVLPSIILAMRGQLMMKDEQIKKAYLSDDYTRFLVMPVREKEKYAIACGSLGGFGGFFSKKFRTHDYYLGRRNCQKFLQDHFSAPEDANNPILQFGYEDSEIKFGRVKVNNKNYLALVPDMRIEGNETSGYRLVKPPVEEVYPYPKLKLSYILGLEPKMKKRIKCVLDNVTNPQPSKKGNDEVNTEQTWKSPIVERLRKKTWFEQNILGTVKGRALNFYVWVGKTFAKGPAAEFFIDAIINDMDKRGLIEDDVK